MRKILPLLCILFILLPAIPVRAESVENIFIGDSRTLMMYFATHTYDTQTRIEVDELAGNEYWKAKGATDYTYMVNEAVPAAEKYLSSGTNFFILFGVNNDNSISMTDKYAKYLNAKSKEWADMGVNVFYVTVGPVGENAWTTDTPYPMGYRDEWICEWNEQVKEKFDWDHMTCLDLYNDIGWDIPRCDDDLHYTPAGSVMIYRYLLDAKTTITLPASISNTPYPDTQYPAVLNVNNPKQYDSLQKHKDRIQGYISRWHRMVSLLFS